MLRAVSIIVSNKTTGEKYAAKSYPDIDYDNNGRMERYDIPVYWLYVDGTDMAGKAVRNTWKCLRFMPFWNDPKALSPAYKHKGWANSGKVHVAKKAVTYYDPNYEIHNTHSPFNGGIQIDGNFLVHAGPLSVTDSGWGAAGCVEVIGMFDQFKNQLRDLSGSKHTDANKAILELVKARKLFVQVDYAAAPNLKATVNGEF